MHRRTLKSIAAFSKQRAKRHIFERAHKKQRDADKIQKLETDLEMAYDRVSVIFHTQTS
jgi:hypothetical protein